MDHLDDDDDMHQTRPKIDLNPNKSNMNFTFSDLVRSWGFRFGQAQKLHLGH